MLIQNATSSPMPAPRVVNDAAEMPVVGASAPATGHVPVDMPKTADPQTAAQPSPAQLNAAVENLNKAMKEINSSLEFTIDQDTKRTVVRVVDSKTGDTIKQMPSEEALAITRAMDKLQQGLLVRQKA